MVETGRDRARRRLTFRSAFIALLIALTGAWFSLAFWFQLPVSFLARVLCIALLAVVAILLAAAQFTPQRWRGLAVFVVLVALGGVWWSSIRPRLDRNWSADVARTAEGTVKGNVVELRNVRDFEWRSETDFTERWQTEDYDLAKLDSIDLGLSYWGLPAIAHTLVSFGFTDGRHVVFSVGIRQEKGESFSEIGGFFKEFELAFTAGTESDVLRVRTNIRKEDVYLYPLAIPAAGQRALFLSYVALANDLARQPQFYNTLTANCTTVVFDLVRQIDPGLPFDWRIVLTGYLPSYVQAHDGFVWKMPLDALRSRAAISAKAQAADADGPEYSKAIRAK